MKEKNYPIKFLTKAFIELAEISARILIKKYYENLSQKNLSIQTKLDGSPVTEVDIEVESAIRKKINKLFPEHSIYGEELGVEDKGNENEYLWIIDPIDGTKSFMTGSPLFGTLIALLYKREPIFGLVDLPILKQRFWGGKDSVSFTKNAYGNFNLKVRLCPSIEEAILQTTSPELFKTEKEKLCFEKVKKEVKIVRYGGDCFCYASLLYGLIDLVMEANLAPYDYFPLIPIIEGAGGIITDWEGRTLRIDNPSKKILVSGSFATHKKALQLISSCG